MPGSDILYVFKEHWWVILPSGHLDGGRQIVLEVLGWGIVIAAAVQKD